MLQNLPNMTQRLHLAQAIVAWRSTSGTSSGFHCDNHFRVISSLPGSP